MANEMFDVVMTCTIDGGSEVFKGFDTKNHAKDFVENSKQMDRDSGNESWFLYSIEPAVA
jgi:hypothetical protein